MNRINPNYITLLRLIFFAPLACVFLANNYPWSALVAMTLGELTDFMDGQIARRTNQISDVGKLLDPLCDSVFHMTIWMTLLHIGWVPLWAVILFFTRDAIVQTIRSCLVKHGITLAARKSGKIKAVFQGGAQFTLVLLHIFPEGNVFPHMQITATVLAVLATVWSFIDYSCCFYWHVREKKVVFTQGAKA